MKQLIKYPGSKWGLSDWITGFFPKHHSYLEPFFGSGATLFNKAPSKIETINDIDNEVVNLFECIKQDPERLAALVSMTPYSRTVFDNAFKVQSEDPYEKALNFIIRCDMSHGFRANNVSSGFKMDIQGRENSYAVKHWNILPERVMQCAVRLKQVQIENKPALDVIERFNHSNVLIYCDPPYMLNTRHGKQYKHEMTEKDHENLLEVLLAHKGPVILSGYHSKLYDDVLKSWHVEEHINRNQVNKKTMEVLWMNFEPIPQLTIKDLMIGSESNE